MGNPSSSASPPPSPHPPSFSTHHPVDFPHSRAPSTHLPSSFATFHCSDLRTTNKQTPSAMPSPRLCPRDIADCPCARGGVPLLACEECVQECADAPCTGLTSECTDQCVVVACTDRHHGVTPCLDPPAALPCPEGADCAALEDFFQCCTDYHAYFSEPRSLSADIPSVTHGFTWDSSFDAFLCGCNETAQTRQSQPANGDFYSEGSAAPTPQLVPSTAFPSPEPLCLANAASLQIHSPQPRQSVLKCEWGGCLATFASLSDLVGHVNLQHLRLPSPHTPTQVQQQQFSVDTTPPSLPGTSTDEGALSCLWADCQLYPTPHSIPGPSTGNALDSALGVLASHLLQDHLGLPRQSTPPAFSEPLVDVGPPTPLPEHDCAAAAHVCRWEGCAAAFASCDALTTHLTAAHVGGGRAHYECFWVGCTRHGANGFASKQKISRHLQSHTGHRPFQCQVCNQNFSEAATLAQHMRRHTQEKPYACDYPGCGKAFAITGALTIHKRTHNGHKPFKCTYCDRAFAESSNLSKHLRTHTGARPYACAEPGCNKSFARPDQLGRHANVHRKKGGENVAGSVAVVT